MTRIGLIGCGTVARRLHLPAFKNTPGAEVVAFASRSVASAKAAAAEYGGGEVFDDWHEVLIAGVDAVDICSPNRAHAEQAVAAARAGKHVLVEKPIACTVDEADAMLAAAREAKVVLHVAHNMRYVPALVAARGEIAAGAIGTIVGLRAAFGHSGPHDWAPEASWFHDPDLSGGGPLIDLGVHAIDFVRFVTQMDVVEVSAILYGDGAVEDAAHVLLRFATGATGAVHSSWVTRPAPDFGLTVFGTDGTVHVDARTPLHVRPSAGDKRVVDLPEISSNACADFVRAINGDEGLPGATGADGRAALAVVCAAYEAARTGRTVPVS